MPGARLPAVGPVAAELDEICSDSEHISSDSAPERLDATAPADATPRRRVAPSDAP